MTSPRRAFQASESCALGPDAQELSCPLQSLQSLVSDVVNGFHEEVQHFVGIQDRKSTRLNSSHVSISYAVFCLKKKINKYMLINDNINNNTRIEHTIHNCNVKH